MNEPDGSATLKTACGMARCVGWAKAASCFAAIAGLDAMGGVGCFGDGGWLPRRLPT